MRKYRFEMTDQQSGYSPSISMKELIGDNPMLLPAISRFNIAFGFGDSSVAEACLANGVNTDTFLCVCNLISGHAFDADSISLGSLIDYLKRAHVSFLDVRLPQIRHSLIDAVNSADSGEAALLLIKYFDDYMVEVRRHMEHENDVIFRYVERLLEGQNDGSFSIGRYSDSHRDTATRLKELKDIFIYHFRQRDNIRLSGALLDIIICERDMMHHFDVENLLLVPAVKRLEASIRMSAPADSVASEPDREVDDERLSSLSEREKDIIRGVAHGLVNKEIADRLCISVHTVATHRRNISAKLDIHTSAGLVIFAIMNHLVDISDVRPV